MGLHPVSDGPIIIAGSSMGFSAHAGLDQLLDWAKAFEQPRHACS